MNEGKTHVLREFLFGVFTIIGIIALICGIVILTSYNDFWMQFIYVGFPLVGAGVGCIILGIIFKNVGRNKKPKEEK